MILGPFSVTIYNLDAFAGLIEDISKLNVTFFMNINSEFLDKPLFELF